MTLLCRTCKNLKDAHEFYVDRSSQTGFKVSCKRCTCAFAKARRQKSTGKSINYDPEAIRTLIYVWALYRRSNGGQEIVEIPVRRRNHVALLPLGCFIRRSQTHNSLFVAGMRGHPSEYLFEMVGPDMLIEILSGLNLEVVVPKDFEPSRDLK